MVSVGWDEDIRTLCKPSACSSATALASMMMEGWVQLFKARELRAWSVRYTASSGLRRKQNAQVHSSGGIQDVKFNTSMSSAKVLSYLQPILLNNVEIQKLEVLSLTVSCVSCFGFSPFLAIFPLILLISFPLT